MRILVVGDGKVGHVLAEHLTREGHNVVIVDIDEEALQRSEDTLDVHVHPRQRRERENAD